MYYSSRRSLSFNIRTLVLSGLLAELTSAAYKEARTKYILAAELIEAARREWPGMVRAHYIQTLRLV